MLRNEPVCVAESEPPTSKVQLPMLFPRNLLKHKLVKNKSKDSKLKIDLSKEFWTHERLVQPHEDLN